MNPTTTPFITLISGIIVAIIGLMSNHLIKENEIKMAKLEALAIDISRFLQSRIFYINFFHAGIIWQKSQAVPVMQDIYSRDVIDDAYKIMVQEQRPTGNETEILIRLGFLMEKDYDNFKKIVTQYQDYMDEINAITKFKDNTPLPMKMQFTSQEIDDTLKSLIGYRESLINLHSEINNSFKRKYHFLINLSRWIILIVALLVIASLLMIYLKA